MHEKICLIYPILNCIKFPYVVPISTLFSGHLFPPRSVGSISQGVCRLRLPKLLLQPWSTRKMPIQKWSQFFLRKCGAVTFFKMNFCRGGMIYTDIWITNETNARGFGISLTMWMPGNCVNCYHRLYQQHPDHADFYFYKHVGMKAQSYMSHLSKILCIMPHIHQSIHRPSCSQHIFSPNPSTSWLPSIWRTGWYRIRHIYWRHLITQRSEIYKWKPYYSIPKNIKKF